MQRFFDTSVLVPVFLVDHPHHQASIELFAQCSQATAACASHSLAELYSTLTRIPPPHRATPEQAVQCVLQVCQRLRLISLDGPGYVAAIQVAASNQISGGTIYDALIAACALDSNAEQVFTWNLRHFDRFGPEFSARLFTPGSSL